jgi:TldD protein
MTSHEDLFFTQTGMDRGRVQGLLDKTLHGADDGELYLEYRQTESFAFDDGRLKAATYDTTQGFGLRAVAGEATGYAHASELSEAAIARAVEAVSVVKLGHSGELAGGPPRTNIHLYTDDSPLDSAPFDAKVKLMGEVDAYARAKDPRVKQVSCSLAGEWQVVEIMRPGGEAFRDVRPLVRLSISLVVEENGRQETGYYGGGGRRAYTDYITPEYWRAGVDEALRSALVNLRSVPAPAGEMSVVLGPGWPGILLHEAVGHGLEGDFKPQEDLGVCRTARAARGLARGHRRRRRHHSRAARLAFHRRRRDADLAHGANRGRHPEGLHAGPDECQVDGRSSDRERPAGILRPFDHAADDQHLHVGGQPGP